MKKFKILIIENLFPSIINFLKSSLHFEFNFYEKPLDINFLNSIIKNYSILIIRSGTILQNEDFFKRAQFLKLIIRCGKGIDNINIEFCKKYFIEIFPIDNANTISVAEFTIGLILCLSKNIVQAHNNVIKKIWKRKNFTITNFNIEKKKIGFVGFGKIPLAIFNRLQSFGSLFYFYDPYIRSYPKNIVFISLKKLFKISDIISIHLPLTEETNQMINKKYFSLMKKTSFLINTSRGSVINEHDLFFHLKQNKIQGAALDVFQKEPLKKSHSFRNLKNIIFTPHIAGSTMNSEINFVKEIKKKLYLFYEKNKNRSCSN